MVNSRGADRYKSFSITSTCWIPTAMKASPRKVPRRNSHSKHRSATAKKSIQLPGLVSYLPSVTAGTSAMPQRHKAHAVRPTSLLNTETHSLPSLQDLPSFPFLFTASR